MSFSKQVTAALLASWAISSVQALEVTVGGPLATTVGISLPFVYTGALTAEITAAISDYKAAIVAAKPDAALFTMTGETTPALIEAAELVQAAYQSVGLTLTDAQAVEVILVF